MNLSIESVDVPLDDELRQLINQKFSSLGKLYDRIWECRMVVRRNEANFSLEASMVLPRFSLVSQQQGLSVEAALQKLTRDLSRQLRRHLLSREEIW